MRILVADDDAISRRVLEATLSRWGYETIAVGDGEEAWQALTRTGGPRLAVVDWMMPGLSGVELCRRLRSRPAQEYVYLIMVSVRGSGEDMIEALTAGADDFVPKPFDPAELRARLRCGLRILALNNDLSMAREALREQATFDELTGAYNRGAIMDLVSREVSRCHRSGQPLSLMMCDVDHFQHVNRTFGHIAGDHVLVETAARLHSLVRHYDYVGRYGGEEFLLVLPGCETDDALALAERLRQATGGAVIETPEGAIGVSLSFGVTTFRPRPDQPPIDREAAVRDAEVGLSQAKRDGRNCVRYHGAAPPVSAAESDV